MQLHRSLEVVGAGGSYRHGAPTELFPGFIGASNRFPSLFGLPRSLKERVPSRVRKTSAEEEDETIGLADFFAKHDEAVGEGVFGQAADTVDIEFAHEVVTVGLDGAGADIQL